MTTVKLRLNSRGFGSMEVDGKDIGYQVSGVKFHAEVGQPTCIQFWMPGVDVDIEAEADAGDIDIKGSL